MRYSDQGIVLMEPVFPLKVLIGVVLLMNLSGCGVMPEIRFVPKPQNDSHAGSEVLNPKVDSQVEHSASNKGTPLDRKKIETENLDRNPYTNSRRWVSDSAKKTFQEAVLAMKQQQWSFAEEKLNYLIEQHPRLSGPHLNLGLVYWKTNRLDLAVERIEMAISVNHKNLDAYNQLAIIKREQSLFSEAEALYIKALHIWPQHAASHRNVGILYELYMGEFEQALYHYEKCQSLVAEKDKQLAGWIFDLKRRLQHVANAE